LQGATYYSGNLPTGTTGAIDVTINSESIVSGGATTLTVISDRPLTEIYLQFSDASAYYKINILSSYLTSSSGGLYTYKVPLQFSQNLVSGSGNTQDITMYFSGSTGSTVSPRVTKSVQAIKVGSGALQITLSWDKPVDLDLHVETPNGALIFWDEPEIGNGELDHDDYCKAGNENVFFNEPLVDGTYTVYVHWYPNDDCYTISGTIEYIVSATINGSPFIFSPYQTGQFSSGSENVRRNIGTIKIQNGMVVN